MGKLFLIIVALFMLAGAANAGVNINTATQSELEMLQGIGPAKASAIIEYREEYGAFRLKDDLVKVSGIGIGTFNLLRGDITVGEVAKQEE